MYQEINTINDVIRERYLYGAELDGKYGFPKLSAVNADLTGVKAVPFNLAQRELNPRNSVCHFLLMITGLSDYGIIQRNISEFWKISDMFAHRIFHFMTVCR